ncbi:hypothetical protein [Dokdonella immobilis]|uniref:Uncharacterized protein n=1 Tax=Dokdonella immobilis TaxID=578942 RepID=A0A1I5AZV0_9GAMM|nr:hypothetical protein [Dokdonella immobilis]SFN67749.1 hypothetical protein SAMN05216289_14619 [Dokdonella immobilis]
MFASSRLLLAAALFATAVSAGAQTRTSTPVGVNPSERAANVQSRHHALISRTAGPKSTNAINTATPVLPVANPVRAYPPSCLADPLPDQTLGPVYSKAVVLPQVTASTGQISGSESVTIKVWRVACSSSEFFTSATLLRIERSGSLNGRLDIYPLFPAVEAAQGNIVFSDDPDYLLNLVRIPTEPNTVIADTLTFSPVPFSSTFVLENYDSASAGFFDFNLAFSLRFDNLLTGGNSDLYFLDVPAYSPTVGTYPAAFQNLPISGYMSTNWFDPDAGGEGIILQIYEVGGDTQNLVVSFTWAAYDPSGIPFWLSGQVTIARGAKSANATMFYRTGGGLGGNAGEASEPIPWGTATVSFPDCNTMVLTYASTQGLPAGVPTGSGTRTWSRIANVNALSCE